MHLFCHHEIINSNKTNCFSASFLVFVVELHVQVKHFHRFFTNCFIECLQRVAWLRWKKGWSCVHHGRVQPV